MDTFDYVNSSFTGVAIFTRQVNSNNEFEFICENFNNALKEILEFDIDEFIGKTSSDIFIDNLSFLNKELEKAFVTGKELTTETSLDSIDKEIMISFFKFGEDYIILQVFDLNKQNEHYKEMYKYKMLFDNSIDSILIFKSSGEILDCNRSALKEYGYLRSELLKLKIYDIIRNSCENSIVCKKSFDENDPNRLEEIHNRKDGSSFPVEVRYISIGVKEGKIIFGIFRNITKEKQKNKEIERLSLAVEQSASPLIIIDCNGNIEYVNKKFESITGYCKEEVIGKIPSIINNVREFKEIWRIIKSGNEWIGDLQGTKKDGSVFWWSVSISPVKDNENRILSFLTVCEDTTEKRELIDNLNRKNVELNSTLEVLKETQLKLMQDDKMATIGQLSAGIAHEINNPLGFVLSNINTLKKYIYKFQDTIEHYREFKSNLTSQGSINLEEENKKIEQVEKSNKIDYIESDLEELFNDTNEGIDRIRNIIIALRNFAHENLNEDKSEYDLNAGITNTLIIARNEVKYTSEVVADLGDIPIIKANGGEINQVLLNIIVNASHAIKEKMDQENITNEKYGVIKINSYKDEEFVYCCIEDNGIGIKQEFINKVVEPFFTTKPVGKGTGLGLSISYDIIKNKHNGELMIESKVGQGTKMTIKLPIEIDT